MKPLDPVVAYSSRGYSTLLPQRGFAVRLRAQTLAMHLGMKLQRRTLFIQTELTPNVNSIKFKPGKQLASSTAHIDGDGKQSSDDISDGNASATHEFLSRRDAMKSPLATTLFAIDGVESVMFGSDFITITKSADSNWQLMKPGTKALYPSLNI